MGAPLAIASQKASANIFASSISCSGLHRHLAWKQLYRTCQQKQRQQALREAPHLFESLLDAQLFRLRFTVHKDIISAKTHTSNKTRQNSQTEKQAGARTLSFGLLASGVSAAAGSMVVFWGNRSLHTNDCGFSSTIGATQACRLTAFS